MHERQPKFQLRVRLRPGRARSPVHPVCFEVLFLKLSLGAESTLGSTLDSVSRIGDSQRSVGSTKRRLSVSLECAFKLPVTLTEKFFWAGTPSTPSTVRWMVNSPALVYA